MDWLMDDGREIWRESEAYKNRDREREKGSR